MYNPVIDIGEFLELYNPLAFKDARGHIMYFKTYEDAYLEMLERVYKAGPKMVDAVLFCMNTYGMKLQEAQRFVNSWQRYCGFKDQFMLLDWKTGGAERDKDLESFAKGLHMLVEAHFNKAMFLSALSKFKEKIKVEK